MELISKEDAVALITAEMDKIRTHSLVDGTARINLRLAKNIIEDMPTIDIVRCKECRWASPNKEGDYDCKCHIPIFRVDAEGYCYLADRKESE